MVATEKAKDTKVFMANRKKTLDAIAATKK